MMLLRAAGAMLLLSNANAEFSQEDSGMLQLHKMGDSAHEDCSKGGCKPGAKICCKAMTAECLSCSSDSTVEEFCSANPKTSGCPKICCEAMTAECLSCSADSTVEKFCSANPKTNGCPEALFTLKQTGGSCTSGYLGKESGYSTDLSACKASCAEVAACSHVSFCPSGTACPGGHKNKCALYSTCQSVSDENGSWAGYTIYEKKVPAPTWTLLARQTHPFMFKKNQWELNADKPDADNYAILDKWAEFKQNGSYRLKLEWPKDNLKTQEWEQTSNPIQDCKTASKIWGVKGYSNVANVPYTSNRWGGLECGGQQASLLDATVLHGNWFYAVGSFQSWGGGIPGPASAVKQVELWVQTER